MTNADQPTEDRIALRHVGPHGQPTGEINRIALREIREARDMTQVDLAKEAGISQPYMCRLESGARRFVGPEVYFALVAALGVDDDALLVDDDAADAA